MAKREQERREQGLDSVGDLKRRSRAKPLSVRVSDVTMPQEKERLFDAGVESILRALIRRQIGERNE